MVLDGPDRVEAELVGEARDPDLLGEAQRLNLAIDPSTGAELARVAFGELRVGPKSAGANPGPACYGRGGVLPTATLPSVSSSATMSGDFTMPANWVESRLRIGPGTAAGATKPSQLL